MKSNHRVRHSRLGYVSWVLILFLPAAMLICVGASFLYQKERQLLHENHAEHERKAIDVSMAAVKRTLQTVKRDLLYLASRHENQDLIDSPNVERFSRLADDWVAFSRAKQVYDKIRWIDEKGKERLRVDYEKPGPVVAGDRELQDKHKRYFFSETFKLNQGEVFISPLDLNVEGGQIEVPYKPTIRIGTPVFDKHGQKRGINLINYSASQLFDRILQATSETGRPLWLVNQSGYWLMGSSAEDEFGFMFGRDDLTMATRYPDVWQRIVNEQEGQFKTEAGLWTFSTLFPLEDDGAGNMKAGFETHGNPDGRQYAWKMVSLLPTEQYDKGIGALRAKIGAISLILLCLGLMACERIARARTREQVLLADLAGKEERLSTLIKTIPDMIWLKDEDGTYISCNPAFEHFFDIKESSIVGKTDHDLIAKGQADYFRARDRAAIAAGKALKNEEWVSIGSGGPVLLEKTKVPVRTSSGELVGVMGIGRDITERKRIESELRRSHDLLTNLAAQVPGLIYQFRMFPDGRICLPFISESIRSMYGLSPEDVGRDASPLLAFSHPEDKDGLMHSIQESARTMQGWSHEFRVVLSENNVRWLRGDGKPQKLQDGSILWHGYIGDVTERKRSEEELQLAAMVYRESSEAMMITDERNIIIAVNPAFEQMTGYTEEDVVGKNPRILSSGRNGKDVYHQMISELETNGHWQGDLWKRRKNGELFIAGCRVNSTLTEEGTLHRRVALFSDITQRRQSEDMVWQHANFDLLTGLPNRRMFLERLEQEVRIAHRNGTSLALMFIDLDHFKDINDTLGHDSGDRLLKEAAARLKNCVRETDTVARLGGDEFTIILSQIGSSANIERVVNDMLTRLSEPFQLAEEVVFLSGSIGVTFYPQDAATIDSLLKNADQAMYVAKQQGRNRHHYFTPSMQEAVQAKMRLVNDMRNGIACGQFRLMYQPIVELATGAVHKAEALIRWQHPTRGLVSPADFIHIAEDTGLIMIIGDWVFRTATEQAASWQRKYDPQFQVSVNISPVQFRNEGIDLAIWFDHVKTVGLAAEGVVFEITEGVLLDASEDVTSRLLAFQHAGIQVALDDFGTGYSSLSYIKKFDIDYLKIDQSFVRNLEHDADDMALCEAMIVMAHKLGIKVIAEGVETKEQRDLLAEAGCDYAQGYYFSMPLDDSAFADLLSGERMQKKYQVA